MSDQTQEQIAALIQNNPVVLFMKGSKTAPQCGFSAQVVKILDSYHVPYETIDVLEDWNLREGIKSYSNWPTIPQLYIRGKFIGGCDIAMELHRKGELAKAFETP
jgi:monothiol glutaredoxin